MLELAKRRRKSARVGPPPPFAFAAPPIRGFAWLVPNNMVLFWLDALLCAFNVIIIV